MHLSLNLYGREVPVTEIVRYDVRDWNGLPTIPYEGERTVADVLIEGGHLITECPLDLLTVI